MLHRIVQLLVCLSLCPGPCLAAATGAIARAQAKSSGPALGIRGDRFTVDGSEQFLVFVSYFHGLDRPAETLARDLEWLSAQGVRGIRVWPNVSQPALVQPPGRLHPLAMERLAQLVSAAAARHMVVDVTFTREHVDRSVTVGAYGQAVAAAVKALQPFSNVLVDLQNEWNCPRPGPRLALPDLRAIRQAVARANPAIVAAASTSCHPYPRAAAEAFDLLAHHGPRDRDGTWAAETGDLVRSLRSQLALSGRGVVPIYLQEPNRFATPADRESSFDSDPAHYRRSLEEARSAGAAAWAFHTAAAFDLSSGTPFADLLQPGERDVLASISRR